MPGIDLVTAANMLAEVERRKEQASGTDLYSQEACEYRVWNVKEPHRIPGAGERNGKRNCLKAAAGGFIMEKRTAERENPLIFFCFSELLSRWNGTTEADLFF